MRLLVGEFVHETNTFSSLHPGRNEFAAVTLMEGEDIARYYVGTQSCVGAFIDFASRHGIELVWTIAAHDTPAGSIQGDFYQWVKSQLIAGIERTPGVDGVLLSLHGAMVAQGVDDGESDILEGVRRCVGRDVPIAATLDYHANLSQQMVDAADILVGFKTYPHVDEYATGLAAADLLYRTVQKTIQPVCAMHHPPLLPPLGNTSTFREPMLSVMQLAADVERRPGVLSASVFGGFPYADVADAGMSALVITDNRRKDGTIFARELSDMLWSQRKSLLHTAVPIDQAVRQAINAPSGPVVLADISDNTGGGGAGDSVEILRELISQQVQGAAVGPICDSQAVCACRSAGVNSEITISLGAKTDEFHGKPVTLIGKVTYLGDGAFTYRGPISTGIRSTIGQCAIVQSGGVKVLISSCRLQNLDPEIFRSVGIEPMECKIVVVKSSIHFRAGYEPLASSIIEVDGPGLVSPNLRQFPFQKVRRPVFPLDDI